MALLSLIFNRPKHASLQRIDQFGYPLPIFTFDASISETHSRSAEATKNVIEDGSNITDHIKLNPIQLSIEALISDTPTSFIQSAIGVGGAFISNIAGNAAGRGLLGTAAATGVGLGIGGLAGLLTNIPRNPKDAWGYLDGIWKERLPFKMITALQEYKDMVITSLSVPRNAGVGRSLRFSMTVEQIIIVENSFVELSLTKIKEGSEGAVQHAKRGQSAAKEVVKENTKNKSSILLSGFQKLGAFGG
jgi:hypothetical protein